jgi:hypothetical protein
MCDFRYFEGKNIREISLEWLPEHIEEILDQKKEQQQNIPYFLYGTLAILPKNLKITLFADQNEYCVSRDNKLIAIFHTLKGWIYNTEPQLISRLEEINA